MGFFVMFVGFMHFGVLNIFSAVFVSFVTMFVKRHQEESLRAEWEKDSAVIEELRQILTAGNSRDDGRITLKRLMDILENQGSTHLNKTGLDMSAVAGVFKMLDAEATGSVL